MSELFQHLRRVTETLDELGAPYAIVGGLAVSLRTEPRFTRDVDLAVAVESDDDAERLDRALMDRGNRVLAQVEHETADRLATLRLALPDMAGLVVDLLFASCGIEPETVEEAQRIEVLPGWFAPVARPEHLLAMKLLGSDPPHRPQDFIDARALLGSMSSDDVARARIAIDLIEKRGFGRDKDLSADFKQLLDNQVANAD